MIPWMFFVLIARVLPASLPSFCMTTGELDWEKARDG